MLENLDKKELIQIIQKLGMPIFYKTTPRIISCFEDDEKFLKLPRGCIDKVSEICEKAMSI